MLVFWIPRIGKRESWREEKRLDRFVNSWMRERERDGRQ
jgi:hypothetical protein